MTSRNGASRMSATMLMPISISRLITPREPWNGVSHIATTGTPETSAVRDWIRSITKISGTK